MSVVTCPGPGAPDHLLPTNVRDTSCTRRAHTWPCPSPRPRHNQGTIPRAVQGATGANLRDSERISASQDHVKEQCHGQPGTHQDGGLRWGRRVPEIDGAIADMAAAAIQDRAGPAWAPGLNDPALGPV